MLPEPAVVTSSFALAISNNGQVACTGFDDASRRYGWRQTVDVFAFVPIIPEPSPTDINDLGWMCGNEYDSNFASIAWRWDGANVILLDGMPGRPHANAAAMNNDGVIVGYCHENEHFLDACVWFDGAVYSLEEYDNTDWGFSWATAINNRGQILVQASGVGAVLLTPIPDDGFVLLPDSTEGVIHIIDPELGTPLGTIDASFATRPVEVIDGGEGELLVSDMQAGTIWRLDAQGEFIGEFTTEPVNGVRGIMGSLAGHVVGATSDGLRAWDASGEEVPTGVDGDFTDVELMPDGPNSRHLASNLGRRNLQAYDTRLNLTLQSPTGSVDAPAQIELMSGDRLAVAAYGEGLIKLIDLVERRLIHEFPVAGAPVGVFEMAPDSLLISTTTGLYAYSTTGEQDRVIMESSGLGYLGQCAEFRPE